MNRRAFLVGVGGSLLADQGPDGSGQRLRKIQQPLAITMWDFSWLERRWPGAGYENWDLALDELVTRGYDAVHPHLVAPAS